MGERYTIAQKPVEDGSSRDTEIRSEYSKDAIISLKPFYQAISDSFSARLLTDKEENIVEDLTVLQPLKWPLYVENLENCKLQFLLYR